VRVGFVQFGPVFGEIKENIRKVESLLENFEGTLVVLPELFNTGYLITSKSEAVELSEEVPTGETTKALYRMAKEKNIYIVAGLIERCREKLFNSAVLVSPKGFIASYRKIHLFNEEVLWFYPGDREFPVYDIGLCRIGMMICFDWFFPESMRILSLKGADVICHSANLVLPFCQDAMVTRCLENHVFAITANRTGMENRGGKIFRYTGRSQITGPSAQVLSRASQDIEEIGVVDIDIQAARNKQINAYNHLLQDRKVAFYGRLLEPYES
jgi:predicted amidohydrolase